MNGRRLFAVVPSTGLKVCYSIYLYTNKIEGIKNQSALDLYFIIHSAIIPIARYRTQVSRCVAAII